MKIRLNFLFALFLFFLPFTQAFTIPIGFPLKISEILLILLVLLYIVHGVWEKNIYLNRLMLLLLLLLSIIVTSCLYNFPWTYSYTPKILESRIGRELDSIMKLGYYLLNLFAFYISYLFLYKNINYLRYWLYGAIFASILAWILYIASGYYGIDIHLPGMLDNPQKSNDGFIRSGTFKEGNFWGLYLIVSAAIALMFRRPIIFIFFLITSITTRSSSTYIAMSFLLIVYYRTKIFKLKYFVIALIVLIPIIFYYDQIVSSKEFKFYILDKINNEQTPYITSTSQISKIDRKNQLSIAYRIGLDNLWLGVGPANYKYHYDEYNIVFREYIMSPENIKTFAYYLSPTIANNIYLEIFCEFGIFALVAFLIFLTLFVYTSYTKKDSAMFAGAFAMLIYFNSYPTITLLYIWVFFAIPFILEPHKKWN